jgi:hypothetical protein
LAFVGEGLGSSETRESPRIKSEKDLFSLFTSIT